MEVILAKTAGFCPGVMKAVETAYKEAEEAKKEGKIIYTAGPLIHNEEVINSLRESNVFVIDDLDELANVSPTKVIIRSHGVGKSIYDKILGYGHEIVDATCPFVTNIHKIVEKESTNGDTIIIIGDKEHPEVRGIRGWCKTKPYIVKDESDIDSIPEAIEGRVTVVAQTTFDIKKFQYIVEILTKKVYNINVCRTICNATEKRQVEAKQLASDVDAMIVIGGKSSSNTQKLYNISKSECENTYYIQTLVDLDLTAFKSVSRVGITAGASTPNYIIQEVFEYVRKEF